MDLLRGEYWPCLYNFPRCLLVQKNGFKSNLITLCLWHQPWDFWTAAVPWRGRRLPLLLQPQSKLKSDWSFFSTNTQSYRLWWGDLHSWLVFFKWLNEVVMPHFIYFSPSCLDLFVPVVPASTYVFACISLLLCRWYLSPTALASRTLSISNRRRVPLLLGGTRSRRLWDRWDTHSPCPVNVGTRVSCLVSSWTFQK